MLSRIQRKGKPCALLVGMQTGIAIMETLWRLLKKFKIELFYDPAIPRFGINPKETKPLS